MEASRLRDALGGATRCPRIFIKRDDLTGLATGGNKARKLEYTVAQAKREGATVLVTTGALQSNHARSTAAAARIAGMKCVLVLTRSADALARRTTNAVLAGSTDSIPLDRLEGNLLLDAMLGAAIHFVEPAPEGLAPGQPNPHEAEALERVTTALRKGGEVPYLVPLGASDEIGTVGYVEAAHELEDQLWRAHVTASRVYVGAGTRGTQAGLVLGGKIARARWRVHGVAVSPGDPDKTARAVEFANACARRIGAGERGKVKGVTVSADDFVTHQSYYGPGYAVPTRECQEAIRLVAHSEAVILDPVYTGKTMAALIDHVRKGEVKPAETVVFMHTGGIASVFAQQDMLGLESH